MTFETITAAEKAFSDFLTEEMLAGRTAEYRHDIREEDDGYVVIVYNLDWNVDRVITLVESA